jgi:hypothetical protein
MLRFSIGCADEKKPKAKGQRAKAQSRYRPDYTKAKMEAESVARPAGYSTGNPAVAAATIDEPRTTS